MTDSADHWDFDPGIHHDKECLVCGRTGLILGNVSRTQPHGKGTPEFFYFCKDCTQSLDNHTQS